MSSQRPEGLRHVPRGNTHQPWQLYRPRQHPLLHRAPEPPGRRLLERPRALRRGGPGEALSPSPRGPVPPGRPTEVASIPSSEPCSQDQVWRQRALNWPLGLLSRSHAGPSCELPVLWVTATTSPPCKRPGHAWPFIPVPQLPSAPNRHPGLGSGPPMGRWPGCQH